MSKGSAEECGIGADFVDIASDETPEGVKPDVSRDRYRV
jgi:hypothetical protein